MIVLCGIFAAVIVLLIINTIFLNQRILDLKHALWDSYDWIDPVSCVVDNLEVPDMDEGETLRCLDDLGKGNRAPYVGRH